MSTDKQQRARDYSRIASYYNCARCGQQMDDFSFGRRGQWAGRCLCPNCAKAVAKLPIGPRETKKAIVPEMDG